jgi:uncharacterized membrane protein
MECLFSKLAGSRHVLSYEGPTSPLIFERKQPGETNLASEPLDHLNHWGVDSPLHTLQRIHAVDVLAHLSISKRPSRTTLGSLIRIADEGRRNASPVVPVATTAPSGPVRRRLYGRHEDRVPIHKLGAKSEREFLTLHGDAFAASTARAASQSFGNIALVAVGVIIASGVVTVPLVVGDLADLTTGLFAKLLTGKLVLFCLMLALAATNRLHLVPRLATSNDAAAMTRLWWNVIGELVLGLLVLFVVGALGITPAGDDE